MEIEEIRVTLARQRSSMIDSFFQDHEGKKINGHDCESVKRAGRFSSFLATGANRLGRVMYRRVGWDHSRFDNSRTTRRT